VPGVFSLSNWQHFFVKPLLVTAFVTGTQHDGLPQRIESKERSKRLSLVLNPQLPAKTFS